MKNTKDQDPKTKERPILFSGPMVRAILEGRKTQTRRIVKPQPVETEWRKIACPYGQPGDRLWVRETFATGYGGVFYRASEGDKCKVISGAIVPWKPSIYMPRKLSRLTLEVVRVRVERLQDITDYDCAEEGCCDRTPLQDNEPAGKFIRERQHSSAVRLRYECLWESINGKGSWDANPWVWVVEFKKVAGDKLQVAGLERANL